ncbi:hypothetical protein J2T41_003555 [Pseudomonas citronellolis]|uniref:hypothetical protein n=1 Tax=Pseudomonas citronellolis TaxID=53408 RepID=UPI0020A17FF2|nr:hypothetical protein [Pseudomonas citronellolis]MCP1643920.1 hypothetical protein [Pseudomonas citronellolis]MCP1666845.1 hypothetical protein [Pseudomonas citronellolis]MCP1697452.1 hypothetical protein [Pseudomonas citronellolis]MCP1704384.1 hypothetical protein [Pseudomonas citronellolis]MCP1796843.1 hypothetical protein [Pseudomonas citronellolis]
MSSQAVFKSIAAALALSLSAAAVAGPPGYGPGPGHGWGPGPGHGHGLPDYARSLWIGSALYFVAAGTYYLWNADRRQYVVVEPPPAVQQAPAGVNYDVIAYPARGQTPDQQSRDRYECHTWAVGQSGFDPAAASQAPVPGVADTYRRALGACLNGRGYSIN